MGCLLMSGGDFSGFLSLVSCLLTAVLASGDVVAMQPSAIHLH